MSVTTTQNRTTQSVLHLLADYELHHSDELARGGNGPAPNPRDEPVVENPDWWPSDHRAIPQYRPINRNLDREQRPAGSFLLETVFIMTMFNGVTLNAHASRLWAKTGGRISETMFTYPIGGER